MRDAKSPQPSACVACRHGAFLLSVQEAIESEPEMDADESGHNHIKLVLHVEREDAPRDKLAVTASGASLTPPSRLDTQY
jgi:hypothetical protein